MEKVRTRFAPSPTGFMHVGNLRSALYAYLFAKQHEGAFILRIEDTDLERYVDGAVDVIYHTLQESGITFDEGPNEGGLYGPYVQSERKEIYQEYAKKLIANKSAYYCFCTKERLDTLADENGIKKYDKHCLHLSAAEIEEKLANKESYVIRQNMPTTGISEFDDLVFGHVSVENKELEDHVLIKSDGMPTYNFANVVDDHLMHITHVIRGNEYLSSTPKYNLLYEAFGWEIPKYMHLTPIMKDETRKLSKRYGDANFDDFLKRGYLPEAIVNYIALLGWSPKENKEKFTMRELIDKFSVHGLSKSSSIFDEKKMKWLNGEYIKEMDFSLFLEKAVPFFEQSAIKGIYSYEKFGRLLQSRIEIFSEIPEKVDFLAKFEPYDLALFTNKKLKIDLELAKVIIQETLKQIPLLNRWDEENLHILVSRVAEKLDCKTGQVYTVLRVALTGVNVTPGGSVEMADILGKEEAVKRLHLSLEWLS
ncbi:MAG: glutamate--tRNA ligase [Bacilli bacterium]|jgi:glutamyl-tRNA synthetase|nr:glutamate--tRNA ligase [Bacilli bacterium]